MPASRRNIDEIIFRQLKKERILCRVTTVSNKAFLFMLYLSFLFAWVLFLFRLLFSIRCVACLFFDFQATLIFIANTCTLAHGFDKCLYSSCSQIGRTDSRSRIISDLKKIPKDSVTVNFNELYDLHHVYSFVE